VELDLSWRCSALAVATMLLFPQTAHAHLVSARFGDFYAGMWHPLSALEHLLPMLALSLLAAQQGVGIARRVVLDFCAALLVGTTLAALWPGFPAVTWPNLASFVVLGVLVASASRPAPEVMRVMSIGFGLTHGYANGLAMAPSTLAHLFVPGVAMAGVVLLTLVSAVAVSARLEWQKIGMRVAGSWIAAIGLLMLALP
jgi:urease accessory protein